jgi:nucleoside-diphosphate-sugar epimerase
VEKLLFLGVGTIARALRAALPGLPASGTTRSAPDARFTTIAPLAASDRHDIARAADGAHVVVSFPPDGHSDREFAGIIQSAAAIAYLSSSAVYPTDVGLVNEETPVATEGTRALARLDAESTWLRAGASAVRLPAFYGPDSGLHLSLARGTFRMPGNGENVVSRVHVDDAARFTLAALRASPGAIILAGDDAPAPVGEVARFVCDLFGLTLPLASFGEDIPLSLRASRRIDNSLTKSQLGVALAYPSYREGYRAVHALSTKSPGYN